MTGEEIFVETVPHASRRVVATEVVVGGPTNDGFIHISFIRDIQFHVGDRLRKLSQDERGAAYSREEAKSGAARIEEAIVSMPGEHFVKMIGLLIEHGKKHGLLPADYLVKKEAPSEHD